MGKRLGGILVLLYLLSVAFFSWNIYSDASIDQQIEEKEKFKLTATDLAVMCLTTTHPSLEIELADSRDNEIEYDEFEIETLESVHPVVDEEIKKDNGSPKVLILHTHATESYLPVSEGNYHTRAEENTVRDVGNILERTLEDNGIGVIHDKTLHDYPSYNESYYRSYETALKILEQNPSIECVIDLHRDAISSKSPAATVSVNGKTCAKYSYVIGTTASTYSNNSKFVASLNKTAISKYKGFTGAVLERGYRYNQDLSSKYLLLEIGFNRNQIEDCRNTAEIFGNILADTLKNS